MDRTVNHWKLVKKNIVLEENKLKQEEIKINEVDEQKIGKWGRVREEYIGKNKVLVNDIGDHGDTVINSNHGVRDGAKSSLKMSFFNVVKEATETEKKKKERPSLLKFLEKFDSVDIPESVTPNPYHSFRQLYISEGLKVV